MSWSRPAGRRSSSAVWAALRRIPAGTTTSYGALAATIGRPSAMRAVGLAVGSNPVAIIVPCHRVIGADHSLTGYGGGLPRKRWLLEHEGLELSGGHGWRRSTSSGSQPAGRSGAIANPPADLAPVRGIEVAELWRDRHGVPRLYPSPESSARLTVYCPSAAADAASLRGGVDTLKQVTVEANHHRRLPGILLSASIGGPPGLSRSDRLVDDLHLLCVHPPAMHSDPEKRAVDLAEVLRRSAAL